MKLAIIGFGNWGERLVNFLFNFKSIVDYICLIDIDKEKEQKAKKYNLDFFTNIKQGLRLVDACIIATWENTHYQLAKQCLLAKKHVLIEKPLSVNYNEAKELTKIAKKNKVVLMVDSTFLFDKSFLILKRKINEGEIGKILRVDSFRFSPNVIKPFTNVLVDLLPHELSIFFGLINPPLNKIKIIDSRFVNNSTNEAEVKLDLDSVITRSFLSWSYPIPRREMVLYGSRGVFVWQKKNIKTDIIFYFRYNEQNLLIEEKKWEIEEKQKVLKEVLKDFFQGILNKKEPKTSGRKLLPEIKIFEQILKKAKL